METKTQTDKLAYVHGELTCIREDLKEIAFRTAGRLSSYTLARVEKVTTYLGEMMTPGWTAEEATIHEEAKTMTTETDVEIKAMSDAYAALAAIVDDDARRAAVTWLQRRIFDETNVENQELSVILLARKLLQRAGRIPPAERFAAMVRSGLIDADGRVTIGRDEA